MHAGRASPQGPADPRRERRGVPLAGTSGRGARMAVAIRTTDDEKRRSVSHFTVRGRYRWQAPSAIDPARWTHANAPDPLLPGTLRGAQFHASGQTLRRLPALADQRHHRIGARAGRRPFSTQAAHRPHRARPCRTALSRPDCPKRGARARGRAGAGRCAAGEFRACAARGARREPVMPLELIVAALNSVYLVILTLGHVLVIVAVYQCLRED